MNPSVCIGSVFAKLTVLSRQGSVNGRFHEIKEGWLAESYQGNIQQFGPTPLIAAMRCYVMSRLGDEIEIPQELF